MTVETVREWWRLFLDETGTCSGASCISAGRFPPLMNIFVRRLRHCWCCAAAKLRRSISWYKALISSIRLPISCQLHHQSATYTENVLHCHAMCLTLISFLILSHAPHWHNLKSAPSISYPVQHWHCSEGPDLVWSALQHQLWAWLRKTWRFLALEKIGLCEVETVRGG